MKTLKTLLLAVSAALAMLCVACSAPQQTQYKETSAPSIIVNAKQEVVMTALQKEVTAIYANCEITKIDDARLRVTTAKTQANAMGGGGVTMFTLYPQNGGATEIRVGIVVITPQGGAMQVPWMDPSKEMFLKTGVLQRTKATAEAIATKG